MSGPGVAGLMCVGLESPRSIHLHAFRKTDKEKSGLEVLGCGEKKHLDTSFGADCGTVRGENEICCCYSDHNSALFRPALSAAERSAVLFCFHNAALNTVLI